MTMHVFFFQKTELHESDSRELTVRTLKKEAAGCFEMTVTNTNYGYHKSDDCRPNFYRQKSYLQQTEGLQCATLQTPSFATFPPVQINVTGEVHLKLKRKIVGSRNVYCGFQCQPYKTHISTRTRYTNFSLYRFNADNIF